MCVVVNVCGTLQQFEEVSTCMCCCCTGCTFYTGVSYRLCYTVHACTRTTYVYAKFIVQCTGRDDICDMYAMYGVYVGALSGTRQDSTSAAGHVVVLCV